IKTAITANDASVAQLKASDTVLTALVERQNAVRGYVASRDASFLKKIDKAGKDYAAALAEWQKLAPEDANLINAVKAEADAVDAVEDRQVATVQDPATPASLASTGRLTKVREAIKAFNDQETAKLKVYAAEQDSSYQFTLVTLGVGSALSVLFSVVMGLVLSRAIAKPVREMTEAMDRL